MKTHKHDFKVAGISYLPTGEQIATVESYIGKNGVKQTKTNFSDVMKEYLILSCSCGAVCSKRLDQIREAYSEIPMKGQNDTN